MPRKRLPARRQAETVDLWHGDTPDALAAGLGKLGNGQGPASPVRAISATLAGETDDRGVMTPIPIDAPVGGVKSRRDSGNKMRRNSTSTAAAGRGGAASDRAVFSGR